jgi:hypothetical protein
LSTDRAGGALAIDTDIIVRPLTEREISSARRVVRDFGHDDVDMLLEALGLEEED